MRTTVTVAMMLVAVPTTALAAKPTAKGRQKPALVCTLGENGPQLPDKSQPQLDQNVLCTLHGGPFGTEPGWLAFLQGRVGKKPYRTRTAPLLRKAGQTEATFEATLNAGVFGKGDYELCRPAQIHAEIRAPDGKTVWQMNQTWLQRCPR